MKKLLADPMLRYLAVGVGLFLVFGDLVDDGRAPIEVSAGYVDGLAMLESERLGRAPTEAERQQLVDRHVEEEALYREAIAMGLDEGDVIVRRRLIQKMRFLLDDAIVTEPPSQAELTEHLAANVERFARPARLGFEHRFFVPDRPDAFVADAKAKLVAQQKIVSDPFLLTGLTLRDVSTTEITRTFGRAMVEGLADAPLDVWWGPVRSRYGRHLIRVTSRTEPGAPSLEDPAVRAQVLRSLTEQRHAADVRAAVGAIVSSYPTSRPEVPPTTVAQVQR